MFGYVRVFQPELKVRELEQYRGVYCSLCKQLGKRYGFFARLTLSYDFAFLALFGMATRPGCPGFRQERCSFNPMKKRLCCCGDDRVAFAADMAVLLVYHKLMDSLADDGFFKSLPARCLLPFARSAYKKAKKRYPELADLTERCMTEQARLEAERIPDVDAAAEPFARLMQGMATAAAVLETEADRRIIDRFGYCLGRWVYLVDAVDDLEQDKQTGGYNPYLLAMPERALPDIREYAKASLNACLGECIAAYNLITIYRFDGILRNVLELGLPQVQKTTCNKADSGKEEPIRE